MIKSFDKQNLKTLRMDIDQALATVAKNHGIKLQLGNISFSPEKATTRMTFLTTSGTGNPQEDRAIQQKAHFNRVCDEYGLKPEQWGATFSYGRDQYKVVDLNTKAPKNAVHAQSLRDGKTYIMPEVAIRSLQSKEYKEMYGFEDTVVGSAQTCSNTSAFDAQYKPIGKCNRSATTSRKGFGRNSKSLPYCEQCARLMDESRQEMQAEARANRY